MPRKTFAIRTVRMIEIFSFNEAAARCRGKLGRRAAVPGVQRLASMRPRPDAAENSHQPKSGENA